MEKYDYRAAMVKDIKDYITNNPDLWADPMNEDDISHNIDLALEAVQEFGIDMKALLDAASRNSAARYMDCTIRCYLLGECIEKALEELNK